MAEIVNLLVIDEYLSRNVRYLKGTTLAVSRDEADFLMRDAPGCFKELKPKIDPEAEAMIAPPVDRMVRRYNKK